MSNKEKYLTEEKANTIFRRLDTPLRFDEIIDGNYVFQKSHNSVQQVRTASEQEFELRLIRIEEALSALTKNKEGE